MNGYTDLRISHLLEVTQEIVQRSMDALTDASEFEGSLSIVLTLLDDIDYQAQTLMENNQVSDRIVKEQRKLILALEAENKSMLAQLQEVANTAKVSGSSWSNDHTKICPHCGRESVQKFPTFELANSSREYFCGWCLYEWDVTDEKKAVNIQNKIPF